MNAIRNIGGRADDAKCHPQTRVEVIGLIERWMDDTNGHRIFWMNGPAGGGKTAIMKTIIERAQSADRDVQTINFFFFRGDSTRNSAHAIFATLLYQLFFLYPTSLVEAVKFFSVRPRILDESIEEQCNLISSLSHGIQGSTPTRRPIILLIDGLDECDIEAERSQPDIIHALARLVGKDGSPFRLLVASRPEPHINMAFKQLSSSNCIQTIFLDENYCPEDDIQVYVNAEFDKIKRFHPSGPFPSDWPSAAALQSIVKQSSGQFIYASTVMHYIGTASRVPILSLERVLGIVPSTTSPFANLDSIYSFILNRAEDQIAMLDMLSMTCLLKRWRIPHLDSLSLAGLLQHYQSRYSKYLVESCVLDLSAIAQLSPNSYLEFYHASFPDFLLDETRSGTHFVDVDSFVGKLLVALWNKPEVNDGMSLSNPTHATILHLNNF